MYKIRIWNPRYTHIFKYIEKNIKFTFYEKISECIYTATMPHLLFITFSFSNSILIKNSRKKAHILTCFCSGVVEK